MPADVKAISQPSSRRGRLPGDVWALGFVSLFMDISSEMIHSLLPLFLASSLGASGALIGLIEGVGEATGSVTKLFSGWLSDKQGKRKPMTVLGYSVGAASKPLFAMASGIGLVVFARFADRVGKGIRGAPRDALIADLVSPERRGAAYGLRQTLDTIGALLGPVIAIALMVLLQNNFRAVFWWAVLPAMVSVAILVIFVRDAKQPVEGTHQALVPTQEGIKQLGTTYWTVVGVGSFLTLARFSEAFLLLQGQAIGLTLAFAPVILIVMNITYTLTAYPAGVLSDRIDRKWLLVTGFLVLVIADITIALSSSMVALMFGVILWGIHMGITQGLLSKLVAGAAPANARGTAFGIFHLVIGVCLLAASFVAGLLWDSLGAYGTFLAGAGFAAAGLLAALFLLKSSQ